MHKSNSRWLCTAALVVSVLHGCSSADEKKFNQYYLQGKALYEKHCSNCHQPDGTGLRRVYPPLAHSDYLQNHLREALCLMRHGVDSPLTVNGITFTQPMPGIPTLTDLEIAEIATYIYNSWGNHHGLIEVREATRLLRTCQP
jgi:mono/diheme cytochrome c family protein